MKLKKSRIISLGVFTSVLFGLWWGVPTYRKANADAMVNELCARDGGIKVYETVKLPARRFDQYGVVRVPFELKPDGDFYLKSENKWVVPYTNEGNISIARENYKLYRVTDGKLLGEVVTYVRRGGDPPSPAQPTYYRCPNDIGIEKKVFLRD